MSRSVFATLFVLPALAVTACPTYSSACDTNNDCAPGYACSYATGACFPIPHTPQRCHSSEDCSDDEICDRYGRCAPGPSGAGGSGGEAGSPGASGSAGGG